MEGRAFRNSPVGCSSEGASLPRWTVTRRKHRAGSRYFSRESITSWTLTELKASVMGCKEGEPAPLQRSVSGGALFAVMAQILLNITRVAPAPLMQGKSGGTSLIGAGKLSTCRIFVRSTRAVSCRRP